MEKYTPFLDQVSFEVRFAGGHRYFDVCGQTLIDIEHIPGWLAGEATPNSGTANNPTENYNCTFHNRSFVFTATRLKNKLEIEVIAHQADIIWKIIRDNLGLNEFIRVGCRFHYLLARDSTEKVEQSIAKAPLNVAIPPFLLAKGYQPKERLATAVLAHEGIEYRVALQNIIRTAAAAPDNLITASPRTLSKNQNLVRIELMKARANYGANPTHALCLDVDCAQFAPERVEARDFILTHQTKVATDFLGILEGL